MSRFGAFRKEELQKMYAAFREAKLGPYSIHPGTEPRATEIEPDVLYIELRTEMRERGMQT